MDISLLGTGAMGTAVVESLVAKGHKLTVYNRTRERAADAIALGATYVGTVAEALEASSFIISLVVDANVLAETVLTKDNLPLLRGRTFLKMTTTNGADARKFATLISDAGGECFELAILNFPDEVKKGNMHAMVGASKDDFDKWLPLLSDLGPKILRTGDVGSASIAENAMLQIMMFHITTFAHALAVFEKANLPHEILLDAARHNPLFEIPLGDYFYPRMIGNDYHPALYRLTKHTNDMQLTIDDMEELGLDTAAMRGVRDMFAKGVAAGMAEYDYSSIYKIIRREIEA